MSTSFIKKLITSIVDNKDMPKVQVERELSPILDIFMVDILKKYVGNENSDFRHILSEFPLQSNKLEKGKQTLRSTNIDSLFVQDEDTLVFVELKTDSQSYKESQKDVYIETIKKVKDDSAKFLFNFLEKLCEKSAQKEKYKSAKGKIKDIDRLKEIKDATLVYIIPHSIQEKDKFKDDSVVVITFKDIKKVTVENFKDEWKIISNEIVKLDK